MKSSIFRHNSFSISSNIRKLTYFFCKCAHVMCLASSKCNSAERDCRSSPVHHYIHCDTLHQPSCIAGCYQSVSIFHILVLKEAVQATSCINFFYDWSTSSRQHEKEVSYYWQEYNQWNTPWYNVPVASWYFNLENGRELGIHLKMQPT